MLNKIIVALDGSEHSLKALDFAGQLAQTHGAELFLLHAYHPTSDLLGAEEFNTMVAKRKQAGANILQDATDRIETPSVAVEEVLLEGPAGDAIVTAAKTRKADLVIMGTRGRGSFKGLLFGSVSTKVTQYATCSVLVVR